MLVKLVKHFGQGALTRLMKMFNHCITSNKIRKAWRKAKIIALLKHGKDPNIPRNYRPISLFCHTFKLFKRLILARVAPFVDDRLISGTNDRNVYRPVARFSEKDFVTRNEIN